MISEIESYRVYRAFITSSWNETAVDALQKLVKSRTRYIRRSLAGCKEDAVDGLASVIFELKSLAEILGKQPKASPLDSPEWRKEVAASFLGPVATGAMLDFLKGFRAVVEGKLAADAKRDSVRKLCEEANSSDELDGLFTDQQVEYLLSYCK